MKHTATLVTPLLLLGLCALPACGDDTGGSGGNGGSGAGSGNAGNVGGVGNTGNVGGGVGNAGGSGNSGNTGGAGNTGNAGGDGGSGGGAVETDCGNDVDDDNDSYVDCIDFDCGLSTDCTEVCDNEIDDDEDTFLDCADVFCENDAACVAGIVEVQEIQDGTVAEGLEVTVNNVFVTAIKGASGMSVTMYVQEPQGETPVGHAYPEFAGIAVFIGAGQSGNFTLPVIGNCVSVSGTVTEFNGLTEIASVSALAIQPSPAVCGTQPAPFVIPSATPAVTYADIASDTDLGTVGDQPGPLAETFEGVWLELQTVQATAVADQFNEFPAAQQSNLAGPIVKVDDFFYDADPAAGQNFTFIRGVYSEFINFKLQPRASTDLQ